MYYLTDSNRVLTKAPPVCYFKLTHTFLLNFTDVPIKPTNNNYRPIWWIHKRAGQSQIEWKEMTYTVLTDAIRNRQIFIFAGSRNGYFQVQIDPS